MAEVGVCLGEQTIRFWSKAPDKKDIPGLGWAKGNGGGLENGVDNGLSCGVIVQGCDKTGRAKSQSKGIGMVCR